MKTIPSFANLAFALALAGCGAATESATEAPDAGPAAETTEARLYRWLTGRYDSIKQSQTDRSYYAINLTMCPVDAAKYGVHTLYVEQAMAGRAPYRQRLYVVEAAADDRTQAVSRVFEFNEPDLMIGFCKGQTNTLPTGVVAQEKQGCGVTVTWNAASATFTGGTTGQGCASSLNDASYAASEVILGADRLVSWDRGYDDTGKQVWGATKGGYIFDRLSDQVTP